MAQALMISLKVLAIDMPLLTLLGGTVGWLLAKRDFRGRALVSLLVQLPIILPPSVLGLYLLLVLGRFSFFREAGLLFAFPAAVLGALIPSLPIMIQASRAAFAGVDSELEEAALTLGRRPWEVFLGVTLPLARRTLLVGLALSSARALGDFGVTLMVAGNIPGRTQTLPLYIYGQVGSLNFARAHLAALLLVGVGIASLCLVRMLEAGAHERLA
ncbi:MAG TPA: molybdate ABC transporter permease subunit [Synergistales bacterium]|nr:molybdate ABC transporter permease subunit [Synergistales bacterium]HPC76330.1 molybdate ABC transporter permease subunit [Synergistales bacterium]HRS48884.1 molybdate ABC transporter permease subunit [Thermovirgaceae bacterium]HRU91184.1 molybdate ABC transporter permease subunit [Thermovirgaceae bacterium]